MACWIMVLIDVVDDAARSLKETEDKQFVDPNGLQWGRAPGWLRLAYGSPSYGDRGGK